VLTSDSAPTGHVSDVSGRGLLPAAGPAGPRALSRHRMSVDEFDAIAAGGDDLATLRAGQLSRRMLLIEALAGAVTERRPDLAALAELDASLTVLRAAHRAGRVEVDRLLLHPQVGAWGMRCLRLLYGHGSGAGQAEAPARLAGTDTDDLAAQIGCLGALSATAATLVGRECEVTGHAVDGGVMFPTLGRAVLPGLSGWVRIGVSHRLGEESLPERVSPRRDQGEDTSDPTWAQARRVSLSVYAHENAQVRVATFVIELAGNPGGGREKTGTGFINRASLAAEQAPTADPEPAAGSSSPSWLSLRALVSEFDGHRVQVDVDDIDPFRAFHRVPPTPRLRDDELAVWRHRFDEAWELLVRHHPDRAATVAATLSSLVPLRSPREAEELSASSADACGAVALTLPHSGLALAASLIHELAHSRLSALLDLVPLFEPDRRAVNYSPWRRDPRPVPGLAQGAFAFLALTDFWNDHRRTATGAGARLAQFEYARWRAELPGVFDTLMDSGVLTGLGERFVGGMRRRLAVIAEGDVPEPAAALADIANAEHRITWRLRNVSPGAAFLADLRRAWQQDEPCPPLLPTTVPMGRARTLPASPALSDDLVPSGARFVTHGRLSLSYLLLREPDRFDGFVAEPDQLDAAIPAATPADLLLLTGQAAAASLRYQELIIDQPGRLDAWAGFLLSRRAACGDGDPVVRRPEIVLALHTQLSSLDAASSPVELADWITAGTETRPTGAQPAPTAGTASGGDHSGEGSKTKSTRMPSATSRTSGWSSLSVSR